MTRFRTASAAVAILLAAGSARASTMSDFQARLAQTVWSAQQTEAILRNLPQSSAPVSTPEGLASYASLLSENASALSTLPNPRMASEADRKAMADGLSMVAAMLRDQTALASNRGLTGIVATISSLEEGCRSVVIQLSARK